MVAGFADVEECIEVGSLTARCQHSAYASFQGGNLLGHRIVGGILQTGVEIAFFLEVKQLCHLVRVVVLKRGRLDDRQLYRFSVLGLVACLYAERALSQFLFHNRFGFSNLPAKLLFFLRLFVESLFFLYLWPRRRYSCLEILK